MPKVCADGEHSLELVAQDNGTFKARCEKCGLWLRRDWEKLRANAPTYAKGER
jgi:hypothetical protein